MKQISQDWWISLDETYKTRVDDGSLVFWRPERTIWINIWNDADRGTPQQRLAAWTHDRHDDATDLFSCDDDGLVRFGYLLEEPEDDGGRRFGLYSFTVAAASTVQMVCYFDLEEDTGWAEAVSRSLSFGSPVPTREVEDAVGANGHLVLASSRVIGPDRAAVLLAFRETGVNDDDSGWRFFHGDEDEAYLADPENIALCPLSSLLGLDPSLRAIINGPPGAAWHRADRDDPWHPADNRPAWE